MLKKLSIAVMALALSSGAGKAQLTTLIAIPLIGREIKSIIIDLQDTAQHLLVDGQATGNALEVGLGNQIRVATENARLALQDQQDRAFEGTDKTVQGFFTQLNDTITTANVSVNRALSILEDTNLNLIELTNRLPLTSKVYMYINKVTGLSQLPSSQPYQIDLQGLGLGQDIDVASYKADISINDTQLPASSIIRTPPYSMTILIPNAVLDPLFNTNTMSFHTLKIKLTANALEKCWIFLNCKKTSVGNWSLQLTLVPKNAGELTVTEIVSGTALDPNVQADHISWPVPKSSSKNPVFHCETKNFADDEHVVGVSYTCGGGVGCSFCYNLRSGGSAADYSILQDGHSVQACRKCDGPPAQIDYVVQYRKVNKTAVARVLIPTIPIQFGTPFQIKLSADNPACAYKLTATLVTKQSIYLDNSMSESADHLLVRKGTGDAGPGAPCTPSFVLNTP